MVLSVFSVSFFQDLDKQEVPTFVENLYKAVQNDQTEIVKSSATVATIVDILNTIANVPTPVNATVMQVS